MIHPKNNQETAHWPQNYANRRFREDAENAGGSARRLGGCEHTERLFQLAKQDWAALCEFRRITVGRNCMQAVSAGWRPWPTHLPLPCPCLGKGKFRGHRISLQKRGWCMCEVVAMMGHPEDGPGPCHRAPGAGSLRKEGQEGPAQGVLAQGCCLGCILNSCRYNEMRGVGQTTVKGSLCPCTSSPGQC